MESKWLARAKCANKDILSVAYMLGCDQIKELYQLPCHVNVKGEKGMDEFGIQHKEANLKNYISDY